MSNKTKLTIFYHGSLTVNCFLWERIITYENVSKRVGFGSGSTATPHLLSFVTLLKILFCRVVGN